MKLPQGNVGQSPNIQLAFTVVEMLVALTIALTLTAVALPRVKESLKQNVAARAATMVKASFENARAQAIRTGRPFGIVLHRASNSLTPGDASDDPILNPVHGVNYCNRLSFVQTTFDYRGDAENVEALFSNAGLLQSIVVLQSDSGLLTAIAMDQIPEDEIPISVGSSLTFGELEQAFEVALPPGDSRAIVVYTPLAGEPSDLNNDGSFDAADAGVRVWVRPRSPRMMYETTFVTGDIEPFHIATRPVSAPLSEVVLPGKVIVDLNASGVGRTAISFSARSISDDDGQLETAAIDRPYSPEAVPSSLSYEYRDVIVMFDAAGQLDSVFIDVYMPNINTSPTLSDNYVYTRIPIVATVDLLVSTVEDIVAPETIAIYPERPSSISTAEIADTFLPEPKVTPGFSNVNNVWLTVSPLSGDVKLSEIPEPYLSSELTDHHPELQAALGPSAVDFVRARLFDSRRLSRGAF